MCLEKDKERLKIIKKFLTNKLDSLVVEGREPTMTDLYETIEDETGIDAETAEELIMVCSCSLTGLEAGLDAQ